MESAIDLYMDWLEDTESPLTFHRWSFISAIGTILNRQLVFGEGTSLQTYANQYLVLVGPPASRKNSALRFSKNLLQQVGFDKFSSDRSSKEKFIMDMAEGFATGVEDVLDMQMGDMMEALIYAPELQDFLGQGDMDFISFLTNMWDMPKEYAHRLKNSKSTLLVKPTINMIGGATSTTLAEIFPNNIGGQGFLSRGLLIYGQGARKKITFPTQPDVTTEKMLVEILMTIKNHAVGEAVLDSDARGMLDDIYKKWKPLPDIRLESYTGRRFTSLIKLCMIVACAELSFNHGGVLITGKHVLHAHSMLCFIEGFMPRALGNLGTSKTLELQNKVSIALEASERGLNFLDLSKQMASAYENVHQLAEAVKVMHKLGRVLLDKESGLIYATGNGPRRNIHCDYTLLKEGREYYAGLSKELPSEDEEDSKLNELLSVESKGVKL